MEIYNERPYKWEGTFILSTIPFYGKRYLGVSQNTIDAAYQMLVTEGYIRALPRSGFYVNPLEASLTVRQEPVTSVSIPETGDIQKENLFHLSTNSVDVETFPYAT